LRRLFGEQRQEKLVRLLSLATRGLKEAAPNAVVFQTLVGAGTFDGSSPDDQWT